MSTDPMRTGASSPEVTATGRTKLDVVPVSAETFDEYTLIAKLGHGGMAEVFLALSTGTAGFRKLIVLKRLHPHMEEDPQLIEMFLDEARLAARLNHPHVVQTNKVGEANGSHFMAMEYLEGQSLDRLLRRVSKEGKPLRPQLAARIVADALDGLDYAHNATDFDGRPLGVVHRDVSPHNIFVTYDGTVKILDFGIAKATTQIAETKAGLVKGKFAYIAPEQARGGAVDRRADLWSVGVVLWETLTGKRLFKGANEVATLNLSLTGAIPPLSDYISDVPEGLQAIVDKALARDINHRYATAAEMKDDLESWILSSQTRIGRSDIGALLKSHFKDVQEAQRRTVQECIERAENRVVLTGGGQGPSTGATPLAVVVSTGTGSSSGMMMRQPEKPASRAWLAVGGAALLLLGVGIALGAPLLLGQRAAETPSGPVAQPVVVPVVVPVVPPVQPPVQPREPVVALAADVPAEAETPPDEAESATPNTKRAPLRRPLRPTGGNAQPAPQPAVASTPTPAPQPQNEAYGFLTLDTTPYAVVTLGGRNLGTTPLMRVRLPAGTHTLSLHNPEENITTTYRVTIAEGEAVTRRLGLE